MCAHRFACLNSSSPLLTLFVSHENGNWAVYAIVLVFSTYKQSSPKVDAFCATRLEVAGCMSLYDPCCSVIKLVCARVYAVKLDTGVRRPSDKWFSFSRGILL